MRVEPSLLFIQGFRLEGTSGMNVPSATTTARMHHTARISGARTRSGYVAGTTTARGVLHIPDGTGNEGLVEASGRMLTTVVASACSRTSLAWYSASVASSEMGWVPLASASRDGERMLPAPPRPTE